MKVMVGRPFATILLAGVLAAGVACTKTPDDGQLTAQIQSKFHNDSGLQGKQITVETAAGVVTLSGTVDNDTQRAAASRYASAVPGIKEVVNNLQTATTLPTASVAKPAPQAAPARRNPPATIPRKSSKRRQVDNDANEMATNAPPPAEDNAEADMNSAPPAVAQTAPLPPPPPPAPKKVTVSAGTSVAIRLLDPIDSEKSQTGETFRATLDSPLPTDGDAVPSGYDVKGHIVDVKSAGKFAGQSLVVLQLDSITLNGKSYGLQTDPYRREGSNRTTNTAKKVGAGAVIGAVIGGIAGGGKGAGIGAAAGGGLGGGVQAATKGQQIVLPSETVLSFNLTSPLTVTLPAQGPDSNRRKLDAPQQ
jgi:fructose-specific component phosphotransferase system IIB-like protein